jgi:ribosomal protein L11 methyltransferase
MPLRKVSIAAPDLATAEQVVASLAAEGTAQPLATTMFEQPVRGYLVEAYYDRELETVTIERALLGLGAGVGKPLLESLPDTNWVAVSQAALPPVKAGRFLLHGSHDRPRFAMRRNAIEIEAGEAFGTGHNATTTLCLRALDRLAKQRHFQCVLDIGSGTGVLAIAAARVFPSASVIATDNDPVAVATACENLRVNRLRTRIQTIEASGLRHPLLRQAGSVDLVLANILPRPLIAFAPALNRLIVPGGIAILSGLLIHQVREVVAAYHAAGFHVMQRQREGVWATVTVLRR